MLRRFYTILMLIVPASLCFAQQPGGSGASTPGASSGAVTTAPDDPNAPRMMFETKEHDFGTFEQDGNGTFLFLFTNIGKEPLVISKCQGSCGCTVPSWPQHPIAAGKQDTIKVTYDTHRVGVFVKTVTITSNAKESPDVITIKGKTTAKPTYPAFPGNKEESSGAPFTNNWGDANSMDNH